jgi:hypothetical protein
MTVTPTPGRSSTAIAEGALTADIIGMPAIADFCTSSNDARAETCSTVRLQRQSFFMVGHGPADDLVHGIMPTDVLTADEQLRFGVRVVADGEERRGMDSPGLVEDQPASASA